MAGRTALRAPALDPATVPTTGPSDYPPPFHELVAGRERPYFDFFFDALSAHPERIGDPVRRQFALGYSTPAALKAGFDWYRAMPDDARHNGRHKRIDTPMLYLRGGADPRPAEPYVEGLRAAGARRVRGRLIEDSGELIPIEAPQALVACLKEFASADALPPR